MAHFHVKKKKGRPYLYVREMARINGKLKVVSQTYVGSPERVVQLAQGQGADFSRLQVKEFGSVWAALRMDEDVDLAGIIDGVIPREPQETGPSVGEYFLYAVLNRMVQAKSKRALTSWYQKTDIQSLRPVRLDDLSSERYWAKWDRVSEDQLYVIGRRFFEKIWQLEKPKADCVLFDTTNHYTFMASHTDSELARRGKNKEGRHNLRQIGLGLLVSRESRLPIYYTTYPGNRHDSKEFARVMDEMFGVVLGLDQTKDRITIVVDKGMNSEDNFAWIDEHQQVHFVTTYSTYFAQDLALTPIDRFEPVDTQRNSALSKKGRDKDRLVVYRTTGEFWGKERVVVVTHYPPTARKQRHTLEDKLDQIKVDLLEMRRKTNASEPHWRDADVIEERYHRLCERYHISTVFYDLSFEEDPHGLKMQFRRNHYQIKRKKQSFGKTIIVTDNTDWTTKEIVEAHLDRWQVEDRFRQSKNPTHVGTRPVRHWTDSKIRCHLFTCVVALTYLRRLELRLKEKGVARTANDAMEDLRALHSVIRIDARERKARRIVEQPSKTQSVVLSALGYKIDRSGVLHPLRG